METRTKQTETEKSVRLFRLELFPGAFIEPSQCTRGSGEKFKSLTTLDRGARNCEAVIIYNGLQYPMRSFHEAFSNFDNASTTGLQDIVSGAQIPRVEQFLVSWRGLQPWKG